MLGIYDSAGSIYEFEYLTEFFMNMQNLKKQDKQIVDKFINFVEKKHIAYPISKLKEWSNVNIFTYITDEILAINLLNGFLKDNS